MRAFDREKHFKKLRNKLKVFKTEDEIKEIEQQVNRILDLKKKKNVVILGHNYMTPEVFHGVSDFTGDSLALAKKAAEASADIILFNGVHFMAETAKILNPGKKVLIADENAGCSLAESISGEDVRNLKEQYPGVPVVTYINCTAEVKAEADVVCTSANAVKIVENLDSDRVIMIPDGYLAANVQKQTSKEIIIWEGKCMVHELFVPEDVKLARKNYPEITIIAHPECKPEVTDLCDYTGSTSQMGTFIEESKAKQVLLMTECSMADNLRDDYQGVEFISSCQSCPHMKKITLPKIIEALEQEKDEVDVPPSVIEGARRSLERMLDVGR